MAGCQVSVLVTVYCLLPVGLSMTRLPVTLRPAMDHVKLLAAVSSAVLVMVVDYIVTGLSPGDPLAGLGLTFVVVFSALYAISAVAQLFFWSAEEKNSQAKPYAISAWASSLLTTLVGWALALKCTFLRDWTGHALYDFSIPLSYLIVYFWMKYF
eukprot:CAMPEP_0195290584 /NCGR_PEP_ID=MMETSP0707-20130614/6389_1 /TAXON_ID=33640 /ORGANISM="Asterionellopsis glacialis, Strain CCMP134" /LENGTH=154 /DNA_ID=CAMNT_0040350729 /DNA_START=197 /DNA_END=661 /DNA_ORIENTATION=-